ncbi:PDZ and LIM domain protein 3-like [Ptychodera flava]|uniref:PDZ and LIM domain protein 3-like n=1 Tax=Ptychodera flava TaxID=63121 RepID=UPI00396A86B5
MQFEVKLPGPSPWGFRLGGGKGTDGPLIVSKTTAGGKAAKAQILPNDIIRKMNGQSTQDMSLADAQNILKNTTDELGLSLERKETGAKTPRHAQEPVAHPPVDPNIGLGPQPGKAKVVHLQYNSPVGIYSAQNIAESFKGQTAGLATTGVFGGDSNKPYDTNSEVFRAVHEKEPQYKHGEASERYIERNQDEEMRYHAYVNAGRQSRSFKMLENMVNVEDMDTNEPMVAHMQDNDATAMANRKHQSRSFKMLEEMMQND